MNAESLERKHVGRAFRTLRTSRLETRPVRVCSEDHVHAYVFLCMLAFHVEWHLHRRLAPLLFEDDDSAGALAQRNSPVEPAKVSKSAKAKAGTKMTADGLPVNSFPTFLADLAAPTLNEAAVPSNSDHTLPCLYSRCSCRIGPSKTLEIDPAKIPSRRDPSGPLHAESRLKSAISLMIRDF